MSKPKSTKNILIAKIHIAKKELGLDEATYRDVLHRVTGKTSCSKMTVSQLQDVVKDMESNGFKVKRAKKPSFGVKPNVIASRQPMIEKIGAILADLKLHWNYAHGIAKQMFGIERLQFLNDQQLHKVTQALALHQRREGKKAGNKKDS